jgi:nucleoside-diphosphate-sugar epimerase
LGRLEQVLKQSPHARNVEIVSGDLLSRDDANKGTAGVSVVYHLAAGVEKSFAGAFMNSALTTRNLLDAFIAQDHPRRFVNVSSFATYSNLGLRRSDVLDETCPLEAHSQERGDPYGFGKIKQDQLVIEYGQKHRLPYVILRPGAVFGPGKRSLSGRVGIDTFGVFLHLGRSNILPLTYVDNCAEAIVLAGLKPAIDGEVLNVIDDDLPTSREFLRAYKARVRSFQFIPVPYWLTRLGCHLWEKYAIKSKGQLPPVFNHRRCSAEWKGNRYSNQKLKDKLGWHPRVPMDQAIERFLGQFDHVEN